ncbi:MAG: phenylalanine--tRNA ligase subunit beta [Bacillota bacterium]|nr:phenylalanine--tRNA ligase subunit beta [Bacillota bacterium]
MRVSYNWLKDYIEPGIGAEELAERFTLAGIEVGAVESFGPPLPDVVVGEVKGLEPHPGKSNLTLVETDIGNEVLHIVCGAKNMKVGDKVVVAKPGSQLPGNRLIDETKIYGVISSGMLCSAHELGLELGSEDEILILDGDARLGDLVEKVLEFDDKILCLELTPNRADCFSLLGVAHEVAALTGQNINIPPMVTPETAEEAAEEVEIVIEDTDLCPRYTARVISEITIGRSPLWMQLRLLKSGIRPISNVVDITNYVMWETGQPLHAFDLDLIDEKKIIVRRARKGELLVTLDGVERKLDEDVLVIADSTKPVGLAGVMGGENTEINSSTRSILIEAASFNPVNNRRTSRRFNLPSEASQRFERGVNPEAVIWAQNRTALLVSELTGGKVMKGIIDCNILKLSEDIIYVDPRRVNNVLGTSIPDNDLVKILKKLGLKIEGTENDKMKITVPLRRADLKIEEDIIEEVARLYGYDNIPTTLPRGELINNRETRQELILTLTRDVMTAGGYFECITYSFINPSNLLKLRLPEDDWRMQVIPVQNPFSEEQAAMRTTLIPGLLKTIQHNLSFRELNQMLFEIGTIYIPKTLPLAELPEERKLLALAVTGQVPVDNWITEAKNADFFTIKGILDTLFKRMQISNVEYQPESMHFTHPTRSARILINGLKVGYIGQLHPDVAVSWDLDQPVTVAEIDLEHVCEKANLVPRFDPLPRYPSANRDIAVVVPREIPARQLEEVIREAGGELISSVRLFDLYEGRQIPPGKRSLAFSISYRCEERTLTDLEVNRSQEKIEKALQKIGAELRG